MRLTTAKKAVVVFTGAIALMIAMIAIYSLFWNNRGATETRATDNATAFIQKNNIQVKRMTCAGDSNGDGYGTCMVTATDSEQIQLECPTSWVDVNVWRATSCKEVPILRVQGFGGKR